MAYDKQLFALMYSLLLASVLYDDGPVIVGLVFVTVTLVTGAVIMLVQLVVYSEQRNVLLFILTTCIAYYAGLMFILTMVILAGFYMAFHIFDIV